MEWYREHLKNPYYFKKLHAEDLAEALAFGWVLRFDNEQNVVGLEENLASSSPGRTDSLIDVFTPLAPCIRADSCIVLSHDDVRSKLFIITLQFDGVNVIRETDSIE